MPRKYLYIGGAATLVHHRGPTTLPEAPPDLRRGQTLLFLHGEGGNGAELDATLDALSAEHSPLAFDLPAHGRSAGLDSLDSIEAMARFAGDVADKLGLGDPVLVGHSMGGLVALAYALERPARALVLVGASARGAVPAETVELWRRVSEGKERRVFPRERFGPDAPPEVLRRGFGEWVKTDPRATHGDLCAMGRFDVTERLGALDLPCLVVVGEHDEAGRGAAAELAAGIRGARQVVISGCARAVPLERPEELAAAIGDFVRELPA